ncbi:OmpA family protein [Curvibacter gracilis]|uniref:OmpA family protein n=1 Tax=Curvibacter gracilis TaxID=230310 RepID=UPI0004B11E7A|nr:OmpA family protein [Curvibacter gracilis]
MRKTAIAGAVVAALALASCATQGDKAPVSSLRFSYTTEGGKAIGLVRAFDDGERTALQFVTDPPAALRVFDGEGKPLAYQRIGQNAVLPGLYSPVRVQIGPTSATVKSTVPVVTKEPVQQATPEPAAAVTVPVDTNTELLAARAALKLAEKQIAELRAELDKMKATGSAQEAKDIGTKLDRLENLVAEAASVILRVEFGFASADFKPADDVARVLVPAAKAADRINLRGFTDSTVIDEDNKRIALARALAARQYLIGQGVDAKKIRAFYNSAGGFVADNSTPEGRAKNRRVDIELVNTKLAKLSQAATQLAKK